MNKARTEEIIAYATKMHKLGRSHNPYHDEESRELWQSTWDKLCDSAHEPVRGVKRVNFTAFNSLINARESFTCHMIDLLHTDPIDAATSKLWYGESWSRDMLEKSDVQIDNVEEV